jgi:hypothetical protein
MSVAEKFTRNETSNSKAGRIQHKVSAEGKHGATSTHVFRVERPHQIVHRAHLICGQKQAKQRTQKRPIKQARLNNSQPVLRASERASYRDQF